MKIAFLTSEFVTEKNTWHGGLSNYLYKISRGLLAEGHTVHIFVNSVFDETFDYQGIIVHRVKYNHEIYKGLNMVTRNFFAAFLQMIMVAKSVKKSFVNAHRIEKFDIAQCSSCMTPGLFLKSNKISIPVVTRMSSVALHCRKAYNRKNFIDSFLINQLEKIIVKKSDNVYAPSILVQKLVKSEFGRAIDLLEPPYYKEIDSLDFAIFNNHFKHKKYLLFYGSLGRLKGVEFIAKNIYSILKENKDYFFVFIGKMIPMTCKFTFSDLYKKQINRISALELLKSKGKECKNRIIYFNSLPHPQLVPVIKNAQAIILPSMIDNLPNTCIESMSLGKVVLGTYEGGFDQLIKHGENGFLVHYGDSKKFLQIINDICLGKINTAEVGVKAQETVYKQLASAVKVKDLINYYNNCIFCYNEKNKLSKNNKKFSIS